MFHYNDKLNNIKKIFSKRVKKTNHKNNSLELGRTHFYDKKMLSTNISKRANDLINKISKSLYDYHKKNNKNITLFDEYRNNYDDFTKLYNYLKRNENIEKSEHDLILNLAYRYKSKKNVNVDIAKIKKSNFFKNSSLIESNINRLKSFYLLNFDDILKEIKKNEIRNNSWIKDNNVKIQIKADNNNELKQNDDNNINNKTYKENKNISNKYINSEAILNNNINTKNNNDKNKDNIKEKKVNYIQDINQIKEEYIKRKGPNILNIEQIYNLKDIKFLNKMNIITQIKIENIKKINAGGEKNIKAFEENSLFYQNMMKKMKEIEREGLLTERRKIKKEIEQNLNEIEIANKNLKILEEEENNKKDLNDSQKQHNNLLGNKSFYIPTLVKSFPELLYDKINKNESEEPKLKHNISFPLLINNNKEQREKTIHKNNFNDEKKSINNYLINHKNHDKIIRLINDDRHKTKNNFKKSLNIKGKITNKDNHNFSYTSRKNSNKENNNLDEENLDKTTRIYNKISNLSLEEKRKNKNHNIMVEYLKERNYSYLDSINEKKSKKYYRILKDANSDRRNMKVDVMEKVYNRSGVVMDNETRNCFKEINKINLIMKLNEKKLIRTLILRK